MAWTFLGGSHARKHRNILLLQLTVPLGGLCQHVQHLRLTQPANPEFLLCCNGGSPGTRAMQYLAPSNYIAPVQIRVLGLDKFEIYLNMHPSMLVTLLHTHPSRHILGGAKISESDWSICSDDSRLLMIHRQSRHSILVYLP
jgi:hypothetical protein